MGKFTEVTRKIGMVVPKTETKIYNPHHQKVGAGRASGQSGESKQESIKRAWKNKREREG